MSTHDEWDVAVVEIHVGGRRDADPHVGAVEFELQDKVFRESQCSEAH